MKGPEWGMDLPPGLTRRSPLEGGIGMVQIAVRPVDPILVEKLRDGLKEIEGLNKKLMWGSSLGVRSIDGFHYFPDLVSIARDPSVLSMSIVQYDPVRRTFLISGSGSSGNAEMELLWYAFEVFRSDQIILMFRSAEGGELHPPEQMDGRVNYFLSRIDGWKDSTVLKTDGMVLWRGADLASLFVFLGSEIDVVLDQFKSQ
ncbi:MAG: hypothetical protein U9R75_03990 [Candidatus Thermoplasmatota archaeon]|nr:hypothetical protein [Candidatus Thermoplasmatota archaeon]